MSHPIKSILAATCTAAMLAQGAWAQETAEAETDAAPAADPSQVVATVNGTEITLAHVIALRATLPQQYDQFPPNLLLQGIVDQLVQHTLLKQSLEDEPSLRSRVSIENEERAIIAGEVMAGVIEQDDYLAKLRAAGFTDVRIVRQKPIDLPDEVLLSVLSPEDVARFRTSGVALRSVTVCIGTRSSTSHSRGGTGSP